MRWQNDSVLANSLRQSPLEPSQGWGPEVYELRTRHLSSFWTGKDAGVVSGRISACQEQKLTFRDSFCRGAMIPSEIVVPVAFKNLAYRRAGLIRVKQK
jgi:hypothetical protein